MLEIVLNMVLGLVTASVHSASHVTSKEWTLVQSVHDALGVLLAKKPA